MARYRKDPSSGIPDDNCDSIDCEHLSDMYIRLLDRDQSLSSLAVLHYSYLILKIPFAESLLSY